MNEADPRFWIFDLGLGAPWDYHHYVAFIHCYLRARVQQRDRTQPVLPGLDGESAIWLALRSRARRN